MKHENKTRNKLIACAMCVVMLGATLFGTPWFSVLADDTTTDTESAAGQSYGAWSDQLVTNGSFEAGYVGKEVYGWHKTAMNYATHGKVNTNETEDEAKTEATYLNSFTLATAVEDTKNKVAALKKDGTGYVATTSSRTEVTGGQEYRLFFDYRNKDISFGTNPDTGAEATESDYYGIRLYVEELAADGTPTVQIGNNNTHYYADTAYNEVWSTGMVQFKTQENTKYVVIYLWMGGNPYVYTTMYFDNVLLEENDDYKVINGNFDQVTYKSGVDAAREEGDKGPLGWTKKSATAVFKPTVENTGDARGNVMCVSLVNTDDSDQTVEILSPLIPVTAGESCCMTADYKLVMESTDETEITLGTAVHASLIFCDADGAPLGGGTKRTSLTKVAVSDWTKATATQSAAATDSTKIQYVRVGVYAKLTATEMAKLSSFKLYLDNVVLSVGDETNGYESLGYTKYSATNYGKISSTTYAPNYGIQRVNAGVGREDAVQLYVVNPEGCNGGAIFYSEPKLVTASTKYTMKFEFKIEGVEDSSKNYGADITLRYRKADGTLCTEVTSGTGGENRWNPSGTSTPTNLENTTSWTEHSIAFTTPSECVYVEIGLLIGGTGNVNGELKNSFAKMRIAPQGDAYWSTTDLERANTDLLFKLTEKGNADLDTTGTVDVLDLVMMKKYAADATLITDENKDTVLGVTDMNVNTLINYADIELLHWKLLGVDTEAEAALVQGYNFYQ